MEAKNWATKHLLMSKRDLYYIYFYSGMCGHETKKKTRRIGNNEATLGTSERKDSRDKKRSDNT